MVARAAVVPSGDAPQSAGWQLLQGLQGLGRRRRTRLSWSCGRTSRGWKMPWPCRSGSLARCGSEWAHCSLGYSLIRLLVMVPAFFGSMTFFTVFLEALSRLALCKLVVGLRLELLKAFTTLEKFRATIVLMCRALVSLEKSVFRPLLILPVMLRVLVVFVARMVLAMLWIRTSLTNREAARRRRAGWTLTTSLARSPRRTAACSMLWASMLASFGTHVLLVRLMTLIGPVRLETGLVIAMLRTKGLASRKSWASTSSGLPRGLCGLDCRRSVQSMRRRS